MLFVFLCLLLLAWSVRGQVTCAAQAKRALDGLDATQVIQVNSHHPVVVVKTDTVTKPELVLTADSVADLATFEARVQVTTVSSTEIRVTVAASAEDPLAVYCPGGAGCECSSSTPCHAQLACSNDDGLCKPAGPCPAGRGGCPCTTDKLCFSPNHCVEVPGNAMCLPVVTDAQVEAPEEPLTSAGGPSTLLRHGGWMAATWRAVWTGVTGAWMLASSPSDTCFVAHAQPAPQQVGDGATILCKDGGHEGNVVLLVPASAKDPVVVVAPTPEPSPTAAPTPTPSVKVKVIARINCGGPNVAALGTGLDPTVAWQEDTKGTTSMFWTSGAGVAAAANNGAAVSVSSEWTEKVPLDVFKHERYAVSRDEPVTYTFTGLSTTPDAAFTVNVYTAEVFEAAKATGKRVMDVLVNGNVAKSNYDTFALVGADVGTVLPIVNVKATGEGAMTVTVRRTPGTEGDSPRLQALELIQQSGEVVAPPATPSSPTPAPVPPAPPSGGVRIGEEAAACAAGEFDHTFTANDASTIASVVASKPDGTRFKFAAGTYRGVDIIVPKQGMVFCGEKPDGPGRSWPTKFEGGGAKAAFSLKMQASPQAHNVVIGNFQFRDYKSTEVCTADACAGEIWRGGAIQMTVGGRTFENGWPAGAYLPEDWIIQNNAFKDMIGCGMWFEGTGVRFIGNLIDNTSACGWGGKLRGPKWNVLDGNEIARSTQGSTKFLWWESGNKISYSDSITVSNNLFRDQKNCIVLWFDVTSDKVIISGNTFERIDNIAILYELSRNGTIVNNHVKSCTGGFFGKGSIELSDSHGCRMANNKVEGCDGGASMLIKEDYRRRVTTDTSQTAGRIGGWFSNDNIVTENESVGELRYGLVYQDRKDGTKQCPNSPICSRTAHNNKFVGNTFTEPSKMKFFNGREVWTSEYTNLAGWKALGHDL